MKIQRAWVAYGAETPRVVYESEDEALRGCHPGYHLREMVVTFNDDGSVWIVAPWAPVNVAVSIVRKG